jgi:hypothetical protein
MPTVSIDQNAMGNAGRLRFSVIDFTFDASYPTGGEAFNETVLQGSGLRKVLGAVQMGGNSAAGAYIFHFDTANEKLMAFYPSGGAAPAALAAPAITVPAGATPVTSDAAQPDLVETAGRGTELAVGLGNLDRIKS